MSEPVRLVGVGESGVPMQVSVFRDTGAARCFGMLGIVGGGCTFLAGVTIVIIKASKGRKKDEVLSYASIILIGIVIAALGFALAATARNKSDQDANKESGEASEPALENEAPPPIEEGGGGGGSKGGGGKGSGNGSRSASRQSKQNEGGEASEKPTTAGGNRKKKSTRKPGAKKGAKKKPPSTSSSKSSVKLDK